ncbi:Lsr2 dimerization domain-containing protein [Curtobacterium sp. 22159]
MAGDIIEGSKGRTVQFAFDGNSYEIDLTDGNASLLFRLRCCGSRTWGTR